MHYRVILKESCVARGLGARLIAGVTAIAGFSACAGGPPAPVGQPVPDPSGFAASIRQQSVPATPLQITFGWTLDEAGSRVSGRGVVRTEAPRRSRLDLFGPRGETFLTAALVDGQQHLPPAAQGVGALPSPALFWSVLGIVEPPVGATLSGATADASGAELRYGSMPQDIFVYSFAHADSTTYRLTRLERANNQGVLETVTLEHAPSGSIARAQYRDWSNFRDLTLEIESIRPESSFPPNIWRIDAANP
jgi:hypothetical protein